jgi:hypothetical protein
VDVGGGEDEPDPDGEPADADDDGTERRDAIAPFLQAC